MDEWWRKLSVIYVIPACFWFNKHSKMPPKSLNSNLSSAIFLHVFQGDLNYIEIMRRWTLWFRPLAISPAPTDRFPTEYQCLEILNVAYRNRINYHNLKHIIWDIKVIQGRGANIGSVRTMKESQHLQTVRFLWLTSKISSAFLTFTKLAQIATRSGHN